MRKVKHFLQGFIFDNPSKHDCFCWFSMDSKNHLVTGFESDNRINQINIGTRPWATQGSKAEESQGSFHFLPTLEDVTGLVPLHCGAPLRPGTLRPSSAAAAAPRRAPGPAAASGEGQATAINIQPTLKPAPPAWAEGDPLEELRNRAGLAPMRPRGGVGKSPAM